MATVFERTTVGLLEIDAGSGRIATVNPAACALFGRGRDALQDAVFVELVSPGDRAIVERMLDDVRSGRDVAFSEDLRLQTSEGCVVWATVDLVAARAEPCDRDRHGEPGTATTVVATLVDITAHKMVEDALTSSSVYAEAANRSKTEFLARTSHELRTPLSALLGYAEVLASRLHEPDNLSCLETIKRSGRHLLELVDDLLDLSRIESGHLSLEDIEFSPQELLRDVQRLFDVRAAQRGIDLWMELDGHLPATVRSDPMRLRQVLVNLIGNAIKFTERGHVHVALRSCMRDGHGVLEFAVSDTGIGIAAHQQASLFEPFHQPDSGVARRFGGTGLGLSISKHLVELLGGEIWVESTPDVGSTFRFTVPSIASPGSWSTVSAATAAQRAGGGDLLLGRRVLVADRDPHVCRAHRRTLERAGAWVQTVPSMTGVHAELHESGRCGRDYDAVVLDVDLVDRDLDPGHLGGALAGDEFPGVVVLLGTADQLDLAGTGVDEGMFVPEPVLPDELITAVDSRLRARDAAARGGRDLVGRAHRQPPAAVDLPTALIVDADADLAMSVSMLIEMLGYTVDIASDIDAALDVVGARGPHDVVLVNLAMLEHDPAHIVDALREHGNGDTRLVALLPERDPDPALACQVPCFHASLAAPIDVAQLANALGLEGA